MRDWEKEWLEKYDAPPSEGAADERRLFQAMRATNTRPEELRDERLRHRYEKWLAGESAS